MNLVKHAIEVDGKDEVRILNGVNRAVHQSLIKIQYECEL
jgi:hypothetical protein